jgi:hypothetical protein
MLRSQAAGRASAARNHGLLETLCHMAGKHSELSSIAVLAISMVIAVVGGAVYFLVTPVSPAKLVALGHAAISEPIAH